MTKNDVKLTIKIMSTNKNKYQRVIINISLHIYKDTFVLQYCQHMRNIVMPPLKNIENSVKNALG